MIRKNLEVDTGPHHEVAERRSRGLRVKVDDRDFTPGKYYDWEIKGVPLRLDIGPRDIAQEPLLPLVEPVEKSRCRWTPSLTSAIESWTKSAMSCALVRLST